MKKSCWFIYVLILLGSARLIAQEPPENESRPLNVRIESDAKRYFLGQEIRLTVKVVAESTRPVIRVPKVDQTVPTLVGSSFRQIGASGIGNFVNEVNQYSSTYAIVATRTGKLTIPPFVVHASGRAGASVPVDLTVVAVPSEGRPASWLHGVGALMAHARVDPTSMRLGQSVDFRLVLKGQGALASTTVPVLDGFEPGAVELLANPAERTFLYRFRPTKAGRVDIPGIEVATFDPKFQKYVTTRTPAIYLNVVDIPPFDPASLDNQSPVAATAARPSRVPRSLFVASFAIPLVLGGIYVAWLINHSPRKLARRLAREQTARNASKIVAASIAAYLSRTTNWAGGELTPSEARAWFAKVVDEPRLCDQVADLVDRVDRDRFGGGLNSDEAESLATDAAKFFDEVATARLKKREPRKKTEGGSRNRDLSG